MEREGELEHGRTLAWGAALSSRGWFGGGQGDAKLTRLTYFRGLLARWTGREPVQSVTFEDASAARSEAWDDTRRMIYDAKEPAAPRMARIGACRTAVSGWPGGVRCKGRFDPARNHAKGSA